MYFKNVVFDVYFVLFIDYKSRFNFINFESIVEIIKFIVVREIESIS